MVKNSISFFSGASKKLWKQNEETNYMLYHEVYAQAFCPVQAQSPLHRKTTMPVIMWSKETLYQSALGCLLQFCAIGRLAARPWAHSMRKEAPKHWDVTFRYSLWYPILSFVSPKSASFGVCPVLKTYSSSMVESFLCYIFPILLCLGKKGLFMKKYLANFKSLCLTVWASMAPVTFLMWMCNTAGIGLWRQVKSCIFP